MLATEFEKKLAFDLRGSWQVRALGHAKGVDFAVVMSVLAHSFADAVPVVMHLLIPNWDGKPIGPYLITAGKVDKTGAIVAYVVYPNSERIEKNAVLYLSQVHLRDAMRKLADELKLADRDRIEFFTAIKNWVVADRRLDPTFDPKDPDARRILN